MNFWFRRWNEACHHRATQRLPDEPLRSTGQVMFQNHRLTGALFFAVDVTKTWSVSAPTAPFVLTSWQFLLPRQHFDADAD